MRKKILVGALLLGSLTWACQRSQSVQTGEWPQFRGPGGHGVSPALGLPETWTEDGANILWRSEVSSRGNSSPIVSGDHIFMTGARVANKVVDRFVMALNLDTGELLWETSIGTAPTVKKHRLNTFAAPTPVTDGESVFVLFGDVVASLDREGQVQWEKEIDPIYPEYTVYGAASSPVLTRNAVIVAQDRESTEKPTGWLAAYDKATGEELWKTSWSNTCCSYTTPLIRQRGGTEEIIFAQAGSVTSYDAQTGEPLWHHPLEINQPVASPLMDDDLLVVFSGAHHVRHGAVMRLAGAGEATQVEMLWQTKQMIPQTSSPVLYDGKLYTIVDKGVMACYDAETGRVIWRHRFPGGGGFHSSLLAGDGKVYISNRAGFVRVIKAGEAFQEISTNKLEGGLTATPAFAGQSLLIRTATALFRIADQSE